MVCRRGFPTKARSGMALMLLLWNPLCRMHKSHVIITAIRKYMAMSYFQIIDC
uniref:Uncharacterized protein n=1 Tax=Anguilla anguilla TaxID=7936 RepID=A0A0E9UWK7_ANGAN